VRQGLAFVKGAVVDVTVTFAPPAALAPPAPEPTLPPREQRVADANAPAEIADAQPFAADQPARPAVAATDDLAGIVVSLAVPETWFETAVAAVRHREPTATSAAVERQEEERLRDHVLRLLPPTVRANDRRVVVTRFPVATGRRDAVAKPAPPVPAPVTTAPPQQAKGTPTTVGGFVDTAITAVASGRFGDVPREVWVVLSAKMSAILAFIMFRSGTRATARSVAARPSPVAPTRNREAIDWQALDHDDDDEHEPRASRMAA
jgi:hypothetical protein